MRSTGHVNSGDGQCSRQKVALTAPTWATIDCQTTTKNTVPQGLKRNRRSMPGRSNSQQAIKTLRGMLLAIS